jgi:hypothetical protein
MQHHEHRRRRLEALRDEYGSAGHCDLALDEPLPRWALLETHVGPGSHGGWWTLGDDWCELLRESRAQLHASDWPATRLFDLDTEFSTTVARDYTADTLPGDHPARTAPTSTRGWRSLLRRSGRVWRRNDTAPTSTHDPSGHRITPYRRITARLRRVRA